MVGDLRLITRLIAMLCAGCVVVGDQLRPAWNPTWSAVSCVAAPALNIVELRVRMLLGAHEPLPGMTVIATPLGVALASWQFTGAAYSDERGEAVLRLPAGAWIVRLHDASFRTVERTVDVTPDKRCTVELHTSLRSTTVVQ